VEAKVGAVNAAAASEAVAPPAPRPAIREPDPEEEDQLLGELDRANAAATKATAPPPELTPEADLGPQPDSSPGSSEDKTVG